MVIAVIGASSFLGKKITNTFKQGGYSIIGTYSSQRKSFDLTSDNFVQLDLKHITSAIATLTKIDPNIIIHTAAMTNVNLCEVNQEEALQVNTTSVAHLANWCRTRKCKFVYISSDYVFDGSSGPYLERNTPSPINYYGLTKFLAEELIKNLIEDFIIIRPTILYGYNDWEDKLTFPVEVINQLMAKKRIRVDNCRIKYPLLIDDVANGILKLIDLNSKGFFHFCNREPLTRYEWARIVAEVFELSDDLILGAPLDEKTMPPRPMNVELIPSSEIVRFKSAKQGLYLMKKQMEV